MAILTTEVKQKLNKYKEQFLRVCPNNKIDDEGNQTTYTDSEWLDIVVKRILINILKNGNKLIQEDAMTINEFNDIE